MSDSNRLALAIGISLVICLASALPTHAEAIMNIYNDGDGNVVTTTSGSIDLTQLSFEGFGNQADVMAGNQGLVISGASGQVYAVYGFISGPANWGSGGDVTPNSGSGDIFAIDGDGQLLAVPRGYVSGTALNTSEDVFSGNSIDGLGLTPGTYTYTWGVGTPDADSLVVNVSETAPAPSAPEPGTALLGITGAVAMVALRRTRTRVAR